MIHIDPHSTNPIYRQIMQQIRLQIVTGQLEPGQQLESVSNLSSRLVINPMTVSKAYGLLVKEGIVERRPGVGIFATGINRKKARQERRRLLSEALRQAADLAVRLEVPQQEASDLLNRHLRESKNDRRKRE